jgi:hypothetical protein
MGWTCSLDRKGKISTQDIHGDTSQKAAIKKIKKQTNDNIYVGVGEIDSEGGR